MLANSFSQTKTNRRDFHPLGQEKFVIPEIPSKILDSKLMKRGGFDVFTGIVDKSIKQGLLAEAINQRKFLVYSEVVDIDTEEIRGGAPKRKLSSSPGGEYQEMFYKSDWLIGFLRELTTPALSPTGEQGTYSYYSQVGDYLDIHRDIVECDVAVITCLKNEYEHDNSGGQLCLYPERTREPISDVRTTPEKGIVKFMLEENHTVVMYGGFVPHALLPVSKGQNRVVSVLCYRAC